jgi:hypothetical protein
MIRGMWHIQSPRGKGTIEATFWPRTNARWVEAPANREGEWTEATFERFSVALEASLKGGSNGES